MKKDGIFFSVVYQEVENESYIHKRQAVMSFFQLLCVDEVQDHYTNNVGGYSLVCLCLYGKEARCYHYVVTVYTVYLCHVDK